MKQNPGVCPQTLIASWLEQLTSRVLFEPADLTAEEAFEAVVLYGKLLRADQQLVEEECQAGEWQSISRYFATHMATLIQASQDVLHPEGWLVEATEFIQASESETLSDVEETEWAERLISDLDEMQLYTALAGWTSVEIEEAVAAGYGFLLHHSEVAICAANYIRSVFAALGRDDLDHAIEFDLEDFHLTRELFCQLNEQLEACLPK